MLCFRNIAIIVAAGKGLRMHSQQKKQYMELDKIPVLTRTITAFESHGRIDDIILVLPADDTIYCRDLLVKPYDFKTPIHYINGGSSRQESVFNGLIKAGELSGAFDKTIVLIHDGVRPFVDNRLIDDCISKAIINGACIPAVKITDTVKKVVDKEWISHTLDRDLLFQAQTPQVFRLDLVLKAFEHARLTSFSGTDDASIMEHAGLCVSVTPGSLFNIKLTTQQDFALAHYLLKAL
ncbi:MAG: 2-C-methyl-D-erythritol 4-phosphate cytidylyltransferase [Proteobacteria bacterium]|nr:2-C-methyl-D-erythritol 4-phosphate cytidylyltransferase [Desulfobacula sp.]MBU4131551.1 2-C-methyl-D-erythritol 4-phosphate cytidylyltransferase [Pseudomonadota bacterium]